jgi:predicted methyltransferase
MVNNTENRITDEEIERIVNVVLNKVNDKKKCSPCNGETVTRSFKIYKNVLDDFVNFCNNSKYTQYELLSQFILEGIQKYS